MSKFHQLKPETIKRTSNEQLKNMTYMIKVIILLKKEVKV